MAVEPLIGEDEEPVHNIFEEPILCEQGGDDPPCDQACEECNAWLKCLWESVLLLNLGGTNLNALLAELCWKTQTDSGIPDETFSCDDTGEANVIPEVRDLAAGDVFRGVFPAVPLIELGILIPPPSLGGWAPQNSEDLDECFGSYFYDDAASASGCFRADEVLGVYESHRIDHYRLLETTSNMVAIGAIGDVEFEYTTRPVVIAVLATCADGNIQFKVDLRLEDDSEFQFDPSFARAEERVIPWLESDPIPTAGLVPADLVDVPLHLATGGLSEFLTDGEGGHTITLATQTCKFVSCEHCAEPPAAGQPTPRAVVDFTGGSSSNCGKTLTAVIPACIDVARVVWSDGQEGLEINHVVQKPAANGSTDRRELMTMYVIDTRGCLYEKTRELTCGCEEATGGLSAELLEDFDCATDGKLKYRVTASYSGPPDGGIWMSDGCGMQVCIDEDGNFTPECCDPFDPENQGGGMQDGDYRDIVVEASDRTITFNVHAGGCCFGEPDELILPGCGGNCPPCLGAVESATLTFDDWGYNPFGLPLSPVDCACETCNTIVTVPWESSCGGSWINNPAFECTYEEADPTGETFEGSWTLTDNEDGTVTIQVIVTCGSLAHGGGTASFSKIVAVTDGDCSVLTGIDLDLDSFTGTLCGAEPSCLFTLNFNSDQCS